MNKIKSRINAYFGRHIFHIWEKMQPTPSDIQEYDLALKCRDCPKSSIHYLNYP